MFVYQHGMNLKHNKPRGNEAYYTPLNMGIILRGLVCPRSMFVLRGRKDERTNFKRRVTTLSWHILGQSNIDVRMGI